jgi:hypothetical protein
MSDYKKINNITGWVIFAIATLVYALTVEPTASFWDVGEFIAASYKLQVPHPPGAPFFLLVGRMFSFLALGDVYQVAFWINMSAALVSGFSILFLFWSITLLGRKMYKLVPGQEPLRETLTVMGAGVVGALAYTFSDSFWFSAVEAEVYAMSSFFTAFVFWGILKWEVIENKSLANKWLILIAYMMGLSIGVHLLNLVTIPALGLIVYFRNNSKITTWGIIKTLLFSGAIIIVVMAGVIPGLPSIAFWFELRFVNGLGLPFGSGIIFFAILFLGALVYGIRYSVQHKKDILNTTLLCLSFIVIGYSSYALVVIRSNFNPPIDENNPENINTFVSYLLREQYGDRPLFHGQYYTAKVIDQVQSSPVYAKGEEQYEIVDYKIRNIYDSKHTTILPRIYSTAPQHQSVYRDILGLREGQRPNFVDNIHFMFSYQLGHMYMRYFMWNFAGRRSDIQNAGWLRPFESKEGLPDTLANNDARNQFFMLPLILGLIGLFFQFKRDNKSFWVVAMLFFLTGIALVLYLNSPPVEPRERDYIYVGSFYAFAFWIGFGVIAITEFFAKYLKGNVTAPAIATAICLFVPGIMAAEGWDDHDRSDRYFSVDSAKNFLASCAPNAILFTGGDNDTFPLWYAQEVEGFRTDVRVIVLTYLNTDWYIEQMTRQQYESEPLPFSLSKEHYRQGGPNDYLPFMDMNIKALDISQYIQLIRDNHQGLRIPTSFGSYNAVPSKTMYLNVNRDEVLAKGIIPEGMEDLIPERLQWTLKGGGLEKKDLMILDLIQNNNWERPIYFNHTSLQGVNMNLRSFVVQEGTTYRLLPVENPDRGQGAEELVNTDVMFDNLMTNFHWRELNNPNVYYSEDYRNFVANHRSSFNSLAEALLMEGDDERARQVLLKSLEVMPDEGVPFDYTIAQTVGLLLQVGETERARTIADILADRADKWLTYLLEDNKSIGFELQKNITTLNQLNNSFKAAGLNEEALRYQELFVKHYQKLR